MKRFLIEIIQKYKHFPPCWLLCTFQRACMFSGQNENIEFLSPSDQRHECKVPQDKCFLFRLKSRVGTIYHTWGQTQSNEENKADHSHATGLCIIHARERFITPQMTPHRGTGKTALLTGRNITAS